MPFINTEGIIIKRSNFSEADRLLTILSEDEGKIKVLAKGVRKINSRRGGNIELFNRVNVFLRESRTFYLLTEVQLVESYKGLRTDLQKVGYAYYACELIEKLTAEGVENRIIYGLLLNYLRDLGAEDRPIGNLEGFETALLTELGFWPDKLACTDLRGVIEEISQSRLKSPRFIDCL